jgi:serine/threonine protein kinase
MIGKTLGHYRILKKLGAGAMGEVYLAEDERLGRQVALKILTPGLGTNDEAKRLFTREARAASALNHPHILVIYDIGAEGDRDFIAMEYVEGDTLRERIARRDPFPAKTVARIGTQLASALARAHEAGILHRDLKPDNIMLSQDGYTKILDFGLAKLAEGEPGVEATESAATLSCTGEGWILGSPMYMSPEQARGSSVDSRSDLFSLGSVLYELATGRTPFAGESMIDVLHAVIHDVPPAIRQLVPDTSAELERVLTKCLEKDPSDRYQHADDLAVDLRHLQHELEATTIKRNETHPKNGSDEELGATTTRIRIKDEEGRTIERTVPESAVRRRLASFLFENTTADSDLVWLEHAIPSLIAFNLLQDPYFSTAWGSEYARMRDDGLSRAAELSLSLQRKIAEGMHRDYFDETCA